MLPVKNYHQLTYTLSQQQQLYIKTRAGEDGDYALLIAHDTKLWSIRWYPNRVRVDTSTANSSNSDVVIRNSNYNYCYYHYITEPCINSDIQRFAEHAPHIQSKDFIIKMINNICDFVVL